MTTAIELTRQNVATLTRGLPRSARFGLKVALAIRKGDLVIELPTGERFRVRGAEAGPSAEVKLFNWGLVSRALRAGDLGVHESYLAGEWTSPDVTAFLELFCVNDEILTRELAAGPFVRIFLRLRHWLNRNSRSGSRRNIAAHYDLGNDFYRLWLDPSMTYSSAVFEPGEKDLTAAQIAKYRSLAERTEIGAGDHVLEIGCGWGGFAEFAARERGARVTGLTISREQYDFARRRIFEAGLADRVDIRFQDYREVEGSFDRIASIEMFEAVGEEYWPVYFDRIGRVLKPGGRAGIQVITIQDRIFPNYKRTPDFIQRYVFPGGMLPTPTHMSELGHRFGLALTSEKVFGQDYARTLAEWRQRFLDAWPRIVPLGFDDRFKRLWEYYLHYCEAGFRSGNIDVRQLVYVKGA
ncbi:class I SAM-dependent methyltransferase [Methyloraptor flagellatus]|jgi:cyclopropane-fatty-acyl-phospholipid synthase|uniref:Cyclopropane-fatty-acyl-phospholipid synthase family protein n=1 Tax=Methyloraptor flagellatus TaxID=3162530 RepID=A0AAU7XH97_9HYPH